MAEKKLVDKAAVDRAKALLGTISSYTISGVRLHDSKKPENGAVVTFEKGEAASIVAAVKAVLHART